MNDRAFKTLIDFLKQIPSINGEIGFGTYENNLWWVKFSIDIEDPLSWNTIQELGHVLNYLSINERLPTIFYPVSPPPYMNGGPNEFLSWVIECKDQEIRPGTVKKWLEGRLPNPVDNIDEWSVE